MRHTDIVVVGDRTDDIVQWIIDNEPFVIDTYTILEHQKMTNFHNFNVDFHDVIRKQHKDLFISILSVAVSKELGTSMEDFLMVMEDDVTYDRIVGMCETNVYSNDDRSTNRL